MCGIAGGISWQAATAHHLTHIRAAVGALQQRGPDGSGVFEEERLVLGHSRLAIIDTTNAAAQPFESADGRFVIVFNGEIFNFAEHRAALQREGFSFRSTSDTEVLLALFARHGADCLPLLNGFFAFAVYDRQERSLFLARDRFGEKPMLLYHHTGVLLFGSTLNALLAMRIPRALNAAALQSYLHLNYLPPGPGILQNTEHLLPGEYLLCRADGQQTRHRWYTTSEAVAHPPSFVDAAETLRHLLDTAVKRRLVADVPLGAFLSGGIDSSVVAALAAKHRPGLRTFSIGFPESPLFDETVYAERVAAHIGTPHTVFPVTGRELMNSLADTLNAMDEPFADSSALAVNILSRLVRQEVTVALSGDGADELLGGYHKHKAAWLIQHPNLRTRLAKIGGPLWNLLPASRNAALGNRVRQLQRFAAGSRLTPDERYWRWAGFTNGNEAESLLLPHLRHPEALLIQTHLPGMSFRSSDPMNDILNADMALVLPGDMLVKVDRMSMHHSLEVRPPFLDHEVVRFLQQLPSAYKIGESGQKLLLKAATKELLPPAIFARRKQGFEVPLLHWLRHELKPQLDELLAPERLREQAIFEPQAVQRLLHQLHSSAPGDAAARVWAVYVFQVVFSRIMQD